MKQTHNEYCQSLRDDYVTIEETVDTWTDQDRTDLYASIVLPRMNEHDAAIYLDMRSPFPF